MHELPLRPFGHYEDDLDIDFNQRVRPHLVTQILACCTKDRNGEPLGQTFFWDMTIGKRIEYLLTIATLGESSELTTPLRCLNYACQQQIEITLSVEELGHLQPQTDDTVPLLVRVGDEGLQMRRATGGDQLDWLNHSFTDENSAVQAMIQTLVIDHGKDPSNRKNLMIEDWVQVIDNAMEEFDPLVNFSLLILCPYCKKEDQYEIDLETLALQKLREAQLRLLDTVHRLAGFYHWSEQQIFSVPPWRRFHYLTLIEKEKN